MTPQEFVETLDPPETLRHVAIVASMPLYAVSQWMAAVRHHAGIKFDSYAFRINPMRLHGFIDGVAEPRLAITYHDPMEGQRPDNVPSASAIIITEIQL
jgi:hypothetical protein